MSNTPSKACIGCGKVVRMRTEIGGLITSNKARVKHLCPHGKPCIFGHPLAGRQGTNHSTCPECREAATHELTVAVDVLKNDAISSDDQAGEMIERIELLEAAVEKLLGKRAS